jgi:hypothetical protein
MANDKSLRQEIAGILNSASRENESDTPDYILATYLFACLEAFEEATRDRDAWHQSK